MTLSMPLKQCKSPPRRIFGNVILIIMKYSEFLSELSLDCKAISNTQKSVSFDFRQTRSWLKNTRLRLVFSTHFLAFGNRMKHSSSCLLRTFKEMRP